MWKEDSILYITQSPDYSYIYHNPLVIRKSKVLRQEDISEVHKYCKTGLVGFYVRVFVLHSSSCNVENRGCNSRELILPLGLETQLSIEMWVRAILRKFLVRTITNDKYVAIIPQPKLCFVFFFPFCLSFFFSPIPSLPLALHPTHFVFLTKDLAL